MTKSNREKRKELAEFEYEERYHRREWAVQRIGWTVIGVVLLAACAGLFGDGPLAHRQIAIGDSTLEFDRFVRQRAATEWRLQPASDAASDGEIVVSLPSRFLDSFEIRTIAPEPSSSALVGERTVFRFNASDVQSSGSIAYHVEPDGIGSTSAEIQVGERQSATFRQFIYP